MTDEERQRTMDFILAQQAQFSVDIQKLEESQMNADRRMNRADGRLDRAERIVKLMIKAGLRARKNMREQDERFAERFRVVTETLNRLAEAQARNEEAHAHTDKRLDALIDIVREQRNGSS